jgi:uncharacterized caspase-like protein
MRLRRATDVRRTAVLLALAVVSIMVLVAGRSFAQDARPLKGVALVIGNSAYKHLGALPNPANDALAMKELFDKLGFETTLASDRDARKLSRDLDNFVGDAEAADVALVYYAGHGIEAGGENFLVPVDADLSALEAAGEKLVAVSAFIERLRATVPIAIVMLDACRDNPFPPGSMVRLDASSDPAPMGQSGLGETRGAGPISPPTPDTESYGIVITFAAAPGKAALDGEPGGNSPYAAAILRHLDAMAGEEFGTVMRMIAEEVYLKTSGLQRPWVNESLRRLLYFGRARDPVEGEEGEILAERRQLLVTIAALPDFERRQVERVAEQDGVPMDALYGMLRALGSEVPDDPAKLEEMLRAQTERLKTILAEREALKSEDSEITRLSALADKALADGALDASLRFREAAKARFMAISEKLDAAEADLEARRLEGGEVFARTAEAHELKGDYLAAAENYAKAFEQVERWDQRKAWRYTNAEMVALTDHGNYKGDNAALERAIVAGRHALALTSRDAAPLDWAATQDNLGNALWTLGARESGRARLEEAVVAYRAALLELTRERVPLDWAATQNNLGVALQTLGERESGRARLEEAVAAYRAALLERTRERVPLDWAATQNNLGNALRTLGARESGTARLEEAVAAYRAALLELTRERVPLDWAMTQNNLGVALWTLGERESGTARLEEAVAAYRAALLERTRERVPLDWAATQNNLGSTLRTLGERESGTARLEEAVAAYRAALLERTRERVPLDWAMTQNNLGNALWTLGLRESGTARLEEAVAAHRAALLERTRELVPLDWAATQNNLGTALRTLGERESGTARLEEAVAAYRAALLERTRERVPLDWAMTQNNLGEALVEIGKRSGRRTVVEEGRAALIAAWEVYREAGYRQYDDYFQQRIAELDGMLAAME